MTCQVIPGRDYRSDLRFSVIAAAFWRRVHPNSQVCLATNHDAVLPMGYNDDIDILRFEFGKFPPAFGRMLFMASYARLDLFNVDTVFTGHDVVFTQPLPKFDAAAITNYRYHPSQPYCSDLMIFKVKHKGYCDDLMTEMVNAHQWMPKQIIDGPGDQLSWALTLGMPEREAFNNNPFKAPRRPKVLALPAETYLFTPNDYFPSDERNFGVFDARPFDYEAAMRTKVALHFKGKRKAEMFKFAKWAHDQGLIKVGNYMPTEELFA